MASHPFLSKENISVKHEKNMKKMSSMDGKTNYRLEKENSHSPLKAISVKNAFDKDEEFDQLLNDFKNYQVGEKKETDGVKEE